LNKPIYILSIPSLILSLIPLCIVVVIYFRWFRNVKTILYATARMLMQLTMIGFVLAFIFEAENSLLNCAILVFMLSVAGWIALYPTKHIRKQLYGKVLLSLTIACVPTLVLIVFFVIRLTPWYQTSYLIPLAGMIFANSMNAVSLACERFHNESQRGVSYDEARRLSFEASMIPIINSFFAVGLVSLPGMMTGQILAGIDPLIAVRYQIMVMAMLFGSSGLSSAIFLTLLTRDQKQIL